MTAVLPRCADAEPRRRIGVRDAAHCTAAFVALKMAELQAGTREKTTAEEPLAAIFGVDALVSELSGSGRAAFGVARRANNVAAIVAAAPKRFQKSAGPSRAAGAVVRLGAAMRVAVLLAATVVVRAAKRQTLKHAKPVAKTPKARRAIEACKARATERDVAHFT